MLARAVGGPPWLDRATSARGGRGPAAHAARARGRRLPRAGQALVALLDADAAPGGARVGQRRGGRDHPAGAPRRLPLRDRRGPRRRPVRRPRRGPAARAPAWRRTRSRRRRASRSCRASRSRPRWAVLLAEEARLLVAQQLDRRRGRDRAGAGAARPLRRRAGPRRRASWRAAEPCCATWPATRPRRGCCRRRCRSGSSGLRSRTCCAAVAHLDAAVERALAGVSTSPALVDGRFLGTAGFDGFDLAACADAVRRALLHVAEAGAARLHRMLDPRVTGLPPQLSSEPGRQAGLVALHKRAVGLRARGAAARRRPPRSVPTETSLGPGGRAELRPRGACGRCTTPLDVLRDVTACELLAVHQARLLDEEPPRRLRDGCEWCCTRLSRLSRASTLDRPFGREVTAMTQLLGVGWGTRRTR